MNTEQQIRQRIDDFVSDLQALLVEAAKESLVAALGGDMSPTARTSRRSGAPAIKRGRKPGGRVRRSAEELVELQDKVLALLSKKPGLTSEEIQEAMGLEKKDLQRPLVLLRDERRVKTKGQKRGMKYFAA